MNRMGEYQDRTLTDAVAQVIDAGDRLLGARLALVRTEAGRVAGLTVALLVGAAVLLLGWLVLMAAAILALASVLSPAWSLTIVGGAHFIAGLVILAVGARGLSPRAPRAVEPEAASGPRLRAHAE